MIPRCKALLALFLPLVLSACPSREPSPASDPAPAHSPTSLRISPERLSRIEISRTRGGGNDTVTLEKKGDRWQVTSPITYDANAAAVESMVAVFAEIEVLSIVHGDERKARSHGLDPQTAIEVKGWAGDSLESHFRLGHSTGEQTHAQRPGDARILTLRGRCRPLFEKKLDDLRHPVITEVPLSNVEAVTYDNSFGTLEFVAQGASRQFTVKGAPIRNFDHNRAAKNVAVLCGLRAKGFLDEGGTPEKTGLFGDDTPRATVRVRGPRGQRAIHVWVGATTPDGLLHVRTSESSQIYLVSAHLHTSLVPRRSHFERSDETMRELAEHRKGHEDGEGAHVHGAAVEPPSVVPPNLLEELRSLAKEQARAPK